MKKRETRRAFAARVRRITGVSFRDIPSTIIREGECPPGKILARRGETYLFAVGYPDGEDGDGCEVWDPHPENFLLGYFQL